MKKIIIALIIIIVIGVGYWLVSPIWRVKRVDEAAPAPTPVIQFHQNSTSTDSAGSGDATSSQSLSGTFTNGAHDVSGTIRVIDTDNGKVLRFENFKTLNGPDLHIYLATDNTAKDYVEVGPIKGTEGNINYDIPAGTDLGKYNHVLVWCKTFSVLFGSAELK